MIFKNLEDELGDFHCETIVGGGALNIFSGRGVRSGFLKCGVWERIITSEKGVLWTENFQIWGLFLKNGLVYRYCLKWDPCELWFSNFEPKKSSGSKMKLEFHIMKPECHHNVNNYPVVNKDNFETQVSIQYGLEYMASFVNEFLYTLIASFHLVSSSLESLRSLKWN